MVAMGGLYFFSYARANEDVALKKFYRDLRAEVLQRVVDIDSYIDRSNIQPGQEWPDELLVALQSSLAMVCLYSPHYFTREWCGMEWGYFRERALAFNSEPGLPGLMIPVIWVPVELPEVVRAVQTHTLPIDYQGKGMRALALEGGRKYKSVVGEIADLVVAAVRRKLTPAASRPSVAQLRDVFSVAPPVVAPAVLPQIADALRSGPKYVRFIVVAPPSTNAPAERQSAYGSTIIQWQPYHPRSELALSDLIYRISKRTGFYIEPFAFDARLDEIIEDMRRRNSLVVLAVDPWSVDPATDAFVSYDQRLPLNCIAVFPWDASEGVNPDQIWTRISDIFFNQLRLNAQSNHWKLTTVETFTDTLSDALLKASAQVIEYGEVQLRRAQHTQRGLPAISAHRTQRAE